MDEKSATELMEKLFKQPSKKRPVASFETGTHVLNAVHQADLLALPNDKGYKYALIVVDVGTRHIEARPLKTKSAKAVYDALKDIYGEGDFGQGPKSLRSKLKPPMRFECDDGSEFKGDVKKYLTKHNTYVRYGMPGRHKMQALVENTNKRIGTQIMKFQVKKELMTDKVNREWVKQLQPIVDELNKQSEREPMTEKQMLLLGQKQLEKMKTLKPEPVLPLTTKVLVKLDSPIDVFGKKLHGNIRAGDIKYNPVVREINDYVIQPGSNLRYKVTGLKPSFTRSELQEI